MKSNKSPAKKIRSLRRMITFTMKKSLEKTQVMNKKNLLSIKILPSSSFVPNVPQKPFWSLSKTTTIDIPPLSVHSYLQPQPAMTNVTNSTSRQPDLNPSNYAHLEDVFRPGEYERNRENVKNTLKLIDAALNFPK